jgi:lysozyme family protein
VVKTVDEMIADILKHEGGYNDIAEDRGGATNLGISLRYAQGKGLVMDLDGDGDVDKDDIHLVTPEIAAELYKKDFLELPKFDRLPPELQPIMFDCSVNHGPSRAARFLQDALVKLDEDVLTDGVVGQNTLLAMYRVINREGWWKLNNAIVERRIDFYNYIVKHNPSQKKFIKGWLRRANSFWIGFDEETGKWTDKPEEK